MIANGMGHRRDTSLQRFAGLTMSSRTDRAGTLVDDFYTAGVGDWHGPGSDEHPLYWTAFTNPDGTEQRPRNRKDAKGNVGAKHYIADAIFLVLLTGKPDLLDACADALRNPHRAYYLGRRGCIPEQPLILDITTDTPENVLRSWPWLDHPNRHEHARRDLDNGVPRQLPVLEAAPPGDPLAEARPDVPLGFAPLHRDYRTRLVRRAFVPLTPAMLTTLPTPAAPPEGDRP
jgi:CRISPR system Cascade subunit CasD